MYLSDQPLLVQFIHPWSTEQAMSSTQLLYRHLSHPPHHYHLNHRPSFNHQPPTHKHPASTHTHTHTHTHTQTHTHTAQVITDLSSPVPRLCRWFSLVRANPAGSPSPSYGANVWGFLGWNPSPPTTSKAWWMATMPQRYFFIGPLSLLDNSTTHWNWSMSSSWRELCRHWLWLQYPPK